MAPTFFFSCEAMVAMQTGGCGSFGDGLITDGVVDRLAPLPDREKLGSLSADSLLSLVCRSVMTTHSMDCGIDIAMELNLTIWWTFFSICIKDHRPSADVDSSETPKPFGVGFLVQWQVGGTKASRSIPLF